MADPDLQGIWPSVTTLYDMHWMEINQKLRIQPKVHIYISSFSCNVTATSNIFNTCPWPGHDPAWYWKLSVPDLLSTYFIQDISCIFPFDRFNNWFMGWSFTEHSKHAWSIHSTSGIHWNVSQSPMLRIYDSMRKCTPGVKVNFLELKSFACWKTTSGRFGIATR